MIYGYDNAYAVFNIRTGTSWREYRSINGSYIISNNNGEAVSGKFSVVLIPSGINPDSDTLHITDGYFHINK